MKLETIWDVLTNLAYPVAAIATILLIGDYGPIAGAFITIMSGLAVGSMLFAAETIDVTALVKKKLGSE